MVATFGVSEAMRLLCQPQKSLGAGCEYSANYYKEHGRFYTTPQVGDQIFFKSASYAYAHTGIVVEVTATQVITVEGNTSGASGVISNGGGVCKKTYSRSYANIVGYGRPVWTEAQQDETPTAKAKRTASVIASYLEMGDKNDVVKFLQGGLPALGYSCGSTGADGDFGKNTKAAIIKYQKDKGLAADGVVGKDTWTKLLLGV